MKVKTYSNWCDIDYLDKWELKSGDLLYVTFNDGSFEKIKISVHDESYETSDHGNPCFVPVRRAYFITQVYGSNVKVPLAGLEAEWVEKPRREVAYWTKDKNERNQTSAESSPD